MLLVPRRQHREVEQRGAVAPRRVQIRDVLQRRPDAFLVVADYRLGNRKQRGLLAECLLTLILIVAPLLRPRFIARPRDAEPDEKQDDPREDNGRDEGRYLDYFRHLYFTRALCSVRIGLADIARSDAAGNAFFCTR